MDLALPYSGLKSPISNKYNIGQIHLFLLYHKLLKKYLSQNILINPHTIINLLAQLQPNPSVANLLYLLNPMFNNQKRDTPVYL